MVKPVGRKILKPAPSAQIPVVNAPANPLERWHALRQGFESRYPDWSPAWSQEDAVLVIPRPIIEKLAKPRTGHRHRAALLDRNSADAEIAFENLCKQFNPDTIGIWQGWPLWFDLFSDKWQTSKGVDAEFQGSPMAVPLLTIEGQALEEKTHKKICDDVAATKRQALAYAGLLSFHKPYRDDALQLKKTWIAAFC
jgi:hypothetical protein